MEASLDRFRAAHTQVLGVSVDSVYSHANWGRDLGGVSFPLLSDFEPKGAVAREYGLYLSEDGITDRATVLIDAGGTVRYAESVGPSGERDIAALAAECERVDTDSRLDGVQAGRGRLPADAVLYVKSNCGFSRAVLLARDNLHLQSELPVKNVTEDQRAAERLRMLTGKNQAPCLIGDGRRLQESAEIVRYLADTVAPLSS